MRPTILFSLLLIVSHLFGAQMGIDIYPDRPVSRPLDYQKSTFESTAVNIGGTDVITRQKAFNKLEYGSTQADGMAWLNWEFNVKEQGLGYTSIVLNEKSDFMRVPHDRVTFLVKNTGNEAIAFYGILDEFDWTTAPNDRFIKWHTQASEKVMPGATKRVTLPLKTLFPLNSKLAEDRNPKYPLSLKIMVHNAKPDIDYQVALRELTLHTFPVQFVKATSPQATANSGDNDTITIDYTTQLETTTDTQEWTTSYLELRREQEVFWRKDVTEELTKGDLNSLTASIALPPLLPKHEYKLGLAIDGLRVAGSEVKIAAGSSRQPGFPEVTLNEHTGRPTISINGDPFIWAGYASYEWQPGQLEDFGKSGVNLFVVPTNAGRHMHQISPPILSEPGKLDFSSLEESIMLSFSAQPEAKILLRVSLAVPPHVLNDMPDEVVKIRTPNGDIAWEETATKVASYTSKKWWDAQTKLLESLLKFIEEQPYADRIIGLVLTSGATEEWFMYGANGNAAYSDYSHVNQAAFASWSKNQGFPFSKIPDPAERKFSYNSYDVFPSTEEGRAATAYADFMSDAAAEALIHFCQQAKRLTNNQLLTGTMYAYVVQLAGEPRQHLANSLNMSDLLEEPSFDFFMGIPLHNFRTLENGYDTFVTAVSSAQLHGKTYINENDLFSWLHNGLWYRPYAPKDPRGAAIKMHQRVNASDVVYGNQSEWFGLFANWHYDPEGKLQEAFKQINEIKKDSVNFNREPAEEIAFLVDDTSYNWTTPGTKLTDHQIPRALYALGRTGAPVGIYLLSDIDKLPARIKFAVIPWAPAMSPKTRTKLAAALSAPTRDYYLSGPIGLVNTEVNEWRWDIKAMQTLTGLPINVFQAGPNGLSRPNSHSSANMRITLPDGYTTVYDPKVSINPLMFWQGEDAAGFHMYQNLGLFGIKNINQQRIYWSAVAVNDSNFLRHIVSNAGVHCYAPENFTMHASEGIVSITAPKAQKTTIHLKKSVQARDLYSNEINQGSNQEWSFSSGQTRLFLLEEQ